MGGSKGGAGTKKRGKRGGKRQPDHGRSVGVRLNSMAGGKKPKKKRELQVRGREGGGGRVWGGKNTGQPWTTTEQ